jgi:hypothetical protein
MKIYKTWTELKNLLSLKLGTLQYIETDIKYIIWFYDSDDLYKTEIYKNTDIDDKNDFESNYKSQCNTSLYPLSPDKKRYVRAESRPINCTTVFTCAGDTLGETPSIGTGDRLKWDASISEDWTTDGCPEGFKKSVTEIQFCDSIWMKEGTVYYFNALQNSYIDLEVICPHGGYYIYLGEICQNTTGNDLVVEHYVIKHPIQGDVPMGDELNTEACSQELPSYLKYRLTVTVPTSDTSSNGFIEFELYRQRTVIL